MVELSLPRKQKAKTKTEANKVISAGDRDYTLWNNKRDEMDVR